MDATVVVSNTRRNTALNTFSAASRCGAPLPCPSPPETTGTHQDVVQTAAAVQGPGATTIALFVCIGIGLMTGAVARILS